MVLPPGQFDQASQRSNKRGCIQALIILIGCISLGWLTLSQWISQHNSSRFLDASLLAISTSDYSRNPHGTQVAQVGLDIIGDMLHDSQPDPEELLVRLATVTAVLMAPVPTTTPLPEPTIGSTQSAPDTPHMSTTPTPVVGATATNPYLTSTTSNTPEPTATPIATLTAVALATNTAIPLTPTPSATTRFPTPTSTPNTVPSSTNTQQPTQVVLPSSTTTPQPTQIVLPSATATQYIPPNTPAPTNTRKPSNTPRPSNTHFPDKTQKPTKTPRP